MVQTSLFPNYTESSCSLPRSLPHSGSLPSRNLCMLSHPHMFLHLRDEVMDPVNLLIPEEDYQSIWKITQFSPVLSSLFSFTFLGNHKRFKNIPPSLAQDLLLLKLFQLRKLKFLKAFTPVPWCICILHIVFAFFFWLTLIPLE